MKRAGLLRALLVPTLIVGLLTPITAQQASAAATRTITFTKSSVRGGDGTVQASSPTTSTVSCGIGCTGASWTFPRGDVVTFTSTAGTGSSFGGYSGVCSGLTCQITLLDNSSVGATFSLNQYDLSLTKTGAGSGVVASTSSPGQASQVNCGATCTVTYNHGTVVTLTATASAASRFMGWSGGGCSGTGSCVVTMTAATSVFGSFARTFDLAVNRSGSASGTVTSSSSPSQMTQISCGSGPCSVAFLEGATVTLTAAPAAGASFVRWTGDCTASGATCAASMTTSRSVTAVFGYALSVTKAGNGSGAVSSGDGALSCSAACSTTTVLYDQASQVTLTPVPQTGSSFTGWSGACSGTGACQVTMTQARSVTANFTFNRYLLTVAYAGNGSGNVSRSTASYADGYDYGTTVELTATPATSSLFAGWSGACSGTGGCSVTVTQATTVTATFELKRFSFSLDVDGSGGGTIDVAASSGPSLSCDGSASPCGATYDYGTVLTLTASADAGSALSGWTGPCQEGTAGSTCTVLMDQVRQVKATFLLTFTLNVSEAPAGNGSGTFTVSPTGLGCSGAGCWVFMDGTQVTLTASPAVGSDASWSVPSCGASDVCVLTMGSDRDVVLTFTLEKRDLTVTFDGSGDGTVHGSPGGTSCDVGTACARTFDYGTDVTLHAEAAAGSAFTGWSLASCPGTADCVIDLTAATSVAATFRLLHGLAFDIADGNGSGAVTWAPTGSPCDGCSAIFTDDVEVTLTASPSAGSYVTWDVDGEVVDGCADRGLTCTIAMKGDASVFATFTLERYVLDLSISGNGAGSLSVTGGGLSSPYVCSSNCGTLTFDHGSVVTVASSPATGSHLAAWSGDCSGASGCVVTIDRARSVGATFTLDRYALTVGRSGNGTGRVVSADSGIDCGTDCSEIYDHGTAVRLSALPDTGSDFTGWSGDCTAATDGSGDCLVDMVGAEQAVATFTLERYDLSVGFDGSGSGSVALSDPAESSCTEDCSYTYDYGTEVVLTAQAQSGSRFVGWSGACTGASTCSVDVTEATSVTAVFTLRFDLQVSVGGTGQGRVSSADGLIALCSAVCTATYDDGTSVTLVATPSVGTTFTGWSGACEGDGPCVVTMDAARQVSATFTLDRHPLVLTLQGSGSGVVTSAPSGIACGADPSDCSETYDYGTQVVLTAAASGGSVFTGWGAPCTGTGTCAVSLTQARSVVATFQKAYPLQILRSGNGSGTVTSSPSGINCGTTCTVLFIDGTTVTLSGAPTTGSLLSGWTGDCTSTTTCTVVMDGPRSVTATFTLEIHQLDVVLDGTGAGTVTTSPGGPCSATCSKSYDYGTTVTLTAAPSTWPVSEFVGWTGTGNCKGTRASCSLSMTAARTVTATFSRITYQLTVNNSSLGGGKGSVSVKDTAYSCGSSCTSASWSMDANSGVTLTAAAENDGLSYFYGWSGATCQEGTQTGSSCSVQMSQAMSVTAGFARPQGLSVSITGTGVGAVVGSGINCPGTCSVVVPYGTIIDLSARWGSDVVFTGWSVQSCGSSSACAVAVNGATSVIAQFDRWSVNVSVSKQSNDSGTGSVTTTDGKISCGATCASATTTYVLGSSVTFTATPASDSYFVGWQGGTCSGTSTTCVVASIADQISAVAVFGRPVLRLTKTTGGSVSSSPTGLKCANTCTSASGLFKPGVLVTLTATTASGYRFAGWSGDCVVVANTPTKCTVTMNAAKSTTATFTKI